MDALVVPRGRELEAVRRGLARSGARAPRLIDVPIGGGAADAVRQAIAGEAFHSIAIVGMCGLLDPTAEAGQVFTFDEVIDAAGDVAPCDPSLCGRLGQIAGVITARRLLSWHAVVTRGAHKRELGALYFATAVDMESYDVMQVLRAAGIAAGVVRVGSDDAHTDLPNLNAALRPDGTLDMARMSVAMLCAPFDSARLIGSSMRALRRLEGIAEALAA